MSTRARVAAGALLAASLFGCASTHRHRDCARLGEVLAPRLSKARALEQGNTDEAKAAATLSAVGDVYAQLAADLEHADLDDNQCSYIGLEYLRTAGELATRYHALATAVEAGDEPAAKLAIKGLEDARVPEKRALLRLSEACAR